MKFETIPAISESSLPVDPFFRSNHFSDQIFPLLNYFGLFYNFILMEPYNRHSLVFSLFCPAYSLIYVSSQFLFIDLYSIKENIMLHFSIVLLLILGFSYKIMNKDAMSILVCILCGYILLLSKHYGAELLDHRAGICLIM